MLSLQEALGHDTLVAPSCCGGLRDHDIITSGFTPWGPESCPTLDQVLMMAASSATPSPPGQELDGSMDAVITADDDDEERRRKRRKISNRLSAQRSRARKQQQLEELRATAARLRAEKEGFEARLRTLARHDVALRCQNARLRAEAAALSRRLLALQRLARLQVVAPRPMMGLASLMT